MLLHVFGGLVLASVAAAVVAAPVTLVATSPHFIIYAAESEAELRDRAESLERYDAILHRLTETKDAGDVIPLSVYVVADQEAVAAGSNVLGFYDSTASGPFAVVPRKLYGMAVAAIPRIVLFHEYAHHFMLQNFATLYSPWFVEGFAEFYSTTDVTGDIATVGKPEPLRIRDLMSGWESPLAHLIAPGDKQLTAYQTDQLYARAWLLVHYLTLSKQRGGQIESYLRARSGGQTEDQAFQSAFHTSIAEMDKELKAYFATHQLPNVGVSVPEGRPIAIRVATSEEASVAKLTPRLRTLQGSREDMTGPKSSTADKVLFSHFAEKLAIDARADGRRFPTSAVVQEFVAESELLSGQLNLARASADNALKIAPDDSRAHLVLAAATLATTKAGEQVALATARKDIVAANRASPDDPMPLIAYYQSFAEHGETVPPIAVQGLERAQKLAPQDDEVRLMLAKEEVALKRYDVAAGLLRPVAFSPHGGPRRDTAQTLLKSLPIPQEQAPPALGTASDGNAPSKVKNGGNALK